MMPAAEDPKTVLAAGVLVMVDRGQDGSDVQSFLLMQHPRRWDLPKGHAEAGETSTETALREMTEETGISADQVRLDPDFCFQSQYAVTYKRAPGQTFKKCLKIFLGYVAEQPPIRLTEHDSFRWFDWAPPHQIQTRAIDPLLHAVAEFLSTKRAG